MIQLTHHVFSSFPCPVLCCSLNAPNIMPYSPPSLCNSPCSCHPPTAHLILPTVAPTSAAVYYDHSLFSASWLSLPLLPLCSWLWFPHKMESKSKLHSPSSEQVPFIRPPPNPGFPLLHLSTLQWKASGSINRASRGWTSSHASFVSLSARAHTFFFTLAQSLMFSKVVVSFYSSPLTPPATTPPQ